MRTVTMHSMPTRWASSGGTGEVIPVITILLAYVPAIVFVGIVALVKNDRQRTTCYPPTPTTTATSLGDLHLQRRSSRPRCLCPDRRRDARHVPGLAARPRHLPGVAKATAVIAGFVARARSGRPADARLAHVLGDRARRSPLHRRSRGPHHRRRRCASPALHTRCRWASPASRDRKAAASAAHILVILGSSVITGYPWSAPTQSASLNWLNFLAAVRAVLRVLVSARRPTRAAAPAHRHPAAATIGAPLCPDARLRHLSGGATAESS